MTTKTKGEQVPHGSLFATQPGLPTTYVQLNRDPVWHELALQIDGYADLQRRAASLRSWSGVDSRDEREATWATAVDVASQTGDIAAAFEPVRRQLEAQRDAESMSRLHASAVSQLTNDAEIWVASAETQGAFAALLNAALSALIEESREGVALVAGAQSFDDIGADAPRARAFAEMRITADRLQGLLATGAAVLAPTLSRGYLDPGEMDREPWPLGWVLKNYQAAWPTFWRRRRLTIVNRGGDRDLVLPPVAPPWDGLSPLRFLQWVLERGVRFEAAPATDAAARSTALDKAANERRKAEAETRTQPDWTTEGEWTEFRV